MRRLRRILRDRLDHRQDHPPCTPSVLRSGTPCIPDLLGGHAQEIITTSHDICTKDCHDHMPALWQLHPRDSHEREHIKRVHTRQLHQMPLSAFRRVRERLLRNQDQAHRLITHTELFMNQPLPVNVTERGLVRYRSVTDKT